MAPGGESASVVARFAAFVVAALVLAAAVPGGAAASDPGNGSWQPGPARYGMVSKRTGIRMSDGITLSATVTRPTDRATGHPAAGRFPVVLTATPYGKDEPFFAGVNVTPAEDFVPYGYIDVVVDVRGTGSSGGAFELLGPREVKDYVELVHWAAHLSGSTGRVGMAGESYLGLAQLMAAGAVGPGSPLKAIFPIYVGTDLYRDISVPGGMFNSLTDTPYAGVELGIDSLGPVTSGNSPSEILQDLAQHLGGNAQVDGQTFADALDGGERAYDHEFWTTRAPAAAIARIPRNGVAVLAYNNLFDIWQRGDPLVYSILQNAAAGRPPLGPMAPGQRARGRLQVALGPYTHGDVPNPKVPRLALEWFDTWLKGKRTGMADTRTPLHAYELGGGRWVDSRTWPPPAARAHTLYFAGGPSASGTPSLNDGALADAAPHAPAFDRLPWNGGFNSPCSSQTNQQGANFIPGDWTQNPCTHDDRTFEIGALTYTTAPLRRPLTVAGPGNVQIYASANTTNTEWVVTLNDVAPDGSARPLSTGDLIGSLRATDKRRGWTIDRTLVMSWHPYTRASEQRVPAGKLQRYDVELPATIARIRAGHRIRITVQSSYFPYLSPTLPDQNQLGGGRYDVERGGARPSSVTLTVVHPWELHTSSSDWGPCKSDCGVRDPSAERGPGGARP